MTRTSRSESFASMSPIQSSGQCACPMCSLDFETIPARSGLREDLSMQTGNLYFGIGVVSDARPPQQAIAQRGTMKGRAFVLVHGAWHGGWCYSRVAEILRAKGHYVFTPTLTGVGERAHLASL